MATAREEIQAVAVQLAKAQAEINAKIADLDAKIAEGTVTADDLAPLKAAAQALDDVVPDAVEEPPVV